MISSLFNNQSTRILGATLILFGTAALPSQATTLTGFTTYASMMAGMRVTASFADGTSQSAIWQDTGGRSGGAFGSTWSLTATGNTFNEPWTFSNTGLGITSLVIDAISGNSVFDIYPYGDDLPQTDGSADGWGFQTTAGQKPDSSAYSDIIDISQGDLFGKLSLYWQSGFTGQMQFRADTDSGSNDDPVKPKDPVARDTPPIVDFSLPVIDEGKSASTTLFATQPGANTITFFLDGQPIGTDFNRAGVRSVSKDLGLFADNGNYTYTVMARDENGNYSIPVTKTLQVLNVAPTVASLDIPFIYEGRRAKAFMTATDPGADPITFFLNNQNVGTDFSTSGTRAVTAQLGYFADNGYIPYTGYAVDKDNGVSVPVASGLTVLNIAPTLKRFRLSDRVIYQGQSVSAFLASRDPGADSIKFFINGKKVGINPNISGTRNLSTDLGTFTDVGNYTFRGISRDKDQAFSNRLLRRLTVLNVAPTITALTQDLTLNPGAIFDFTAAATDPGINDVLTYNWDLNGDGLFDDFTGTSGQWSFADIGSHKIGVQVSDNNGGVDFSYFNVLTDAGDTSPAPPSGSSCGTFF